MTSPDNTGWKFVDSCFHRTLLLDFMNPAASFMTFLRKLVMINGAVAACFGFFFLLSNIVILLGGNGTDQTLMNLMSSVAVFVSCVVAYVASYRTGDVADWMLSVLMWGSAAGGIFGAFSTVGFPYSVSLASFAIFAAICNMPFRLGYCFVLALIYVIYSYNTAAAIAGDRLPLMVGATLPRVFDTIFRNYLLGLLIFAVPVAACVLQMKHNKTMLATAEAANELSGCVAALLRAYDTDSVAKLLDEYAARGDADPALVATYRGLVENLNQYRPHLPNWMVQQRRDDDDDDDAGDECDSARTRSDASCSQRGRPTAGGGRSRAASTASRSNLESERWKVQSSSQVENVTDNLNAGVAPRSVTVALAVVDFGVSAVSGTARGGLVSAFADRVHQLAAATYCAVHSFVGDTVQLSWNATVKAVQPEVKAARFLARLQAAMKGDDGFLVGGAAAHGKVTTQFAGTGTVQALAISADWRATLRALTAFAATHRAMVVSEPMAIAAQHAVTCRPVEALSVAGATVVALEIVKERDDDNDEWMYVLAKTGGDTVGAALRSCLDGDYGAAVSALAALEEKAAEPLPTTVANLRRRAEAALRDPPPAFPVAACCCAAADATPSD
jgi:hypothetical protein